MAEQTRKPLRQIARPFITDGPTGVSIRDRLKGLTGEDEKVLRAVGEHMGRLACADLSRRCRDGLDHSTDTWAARQRDLTALSSSRWAGSVTSHTHDQWGLSRRAQHAHLKSLDAGIRTIRHRLSLTRNTAATSSPPASPSRTGATSGATASPATGPWPTASTTAPPPAAGTWTPPGPARASPPSGSTRCAAGA